MNSVLLTSTHRASGWRDGRGTNDVKAFISEGKCFFLISLLKGYSKGLFVIFCLLFQFLFVPFRFLAVKASVVSYIHISLFMFCYIYMRKAIRTVCCLCLQK